MRPAFLSFVLLALSGPAYAASHGGEFSLSLDEVHTVTFIRPVATVYVGNPAIVDITMIDSRHAFMQGKGYGRTNIVALNSENVQVFNTHVTVTAPDNGSSVILNRGALRTSFICGRGSCEPAPIPGDGKDFYDTEIGQNTSHQSSARTAATSGNK
jgi:hypothetical protein